MARQYPAKKGAAKAATQAPVDQQDAEDENEPPETPGEVPDAEDKAEGPDQDESSAATPDTDASSEDGSDDTTGEGAGDSDEPPSSVTDDTPNVSPAEQKIYEAVVTSAMQMMFSPNHLQVIVQKLQAGKDDISGAIGHSAAMILQSVRGSSLNNNQPIPDDVMFAAGQEVVNDLCDIAIAAKIFPAQGKPVVAHAALFEGMRVWGATMKGRGQITPEVQAQAQADLKAHGIKQAQAPAQPAQPAPGGAAQVSPPPPGTGAPTAPPGPQAVAAQQGIVNSGAGQ